LPESIVLDAAGAERSCTPIVTVPRGDFSWPQVGTLRWPLTHACRVLRYDLVEGQPADAYPEVTIGWEARTGL